VQSCKITTGGLSRKSAFFVPFFGGKGFSVGKIHAAIGIFHVHINMNGPRMDRKALSSLVLACLFFSLTAQDFQTSRGMVADSTVELLRVPGGIYPADHPEFEVAQIPPRIDFGIIQVAEYGPGEPWGGWSESALGPEGNFYVPVGNHKSYDGAKALVVCYDPVARTHRIILNSQEICGWGNDDFGDGKIHGKPDSSVGPLLFNRLPATVYIMAR
jgi:hypothetical protein